MCINDGHHPPLSISVAVLFDSASMRNDIKPANLIKYNFRKSNITAINAYLSDIDWQAVLNVSDVDVACDIFYHHLYSAFDLFIPKFGSATSKYPPWYTQSIIHALKLKYSYRLKFIQTKNLYYNSLYVNLKKKLTVEINTEFNNYHRKNEQKLQKNPA